MRNVGPEDLWIGSPTTKGRENAGYGGLFWRGPRSFTNGRLRTVDGDGGDELRGTRHAWMGFTGRHDGIDEASTIVMVDDPGNIHHPPQWFARSEEFACMCPAPFFSEEVLLARGEEVTFRYAVVIADGAAPGAEVEALAGQGLAALVRGSRPARREQRAGVSDVVFPGGTSVSRLRVYDEAVPDGFGAAPDGLPGGTPHLHTVSTEAYVVTAGSGSLQTLDRTGYREHDLAPGSIVWFAPGTIHRVVNGGGLEVVVIMSNRGLPGGGRRGDDVRRRGARGCRALRRGGTAAGCRGRPFRRRTGRPCPARRGGAGLPGAARRGRRPATSDRSSASTTAPRPSVAPRAAEWARLREESVLADARRGDELLAAIAAGSPGAAGHRRTALHLRRGRRPPLRHVRPPPHLRRRLTAPRRLRETSVRHLPRAREGAQLKFRAG